MAASDALAAILKNRQQCIRVHPNESRIHFDLRHIQWMQWSAFYGPAVMHQMDAGPVMMHQMDAIFRNGCKASKTGGFASENALLQFGMIRPPVVHAHCTWVSLLDGPVDEIRNPVSNL